MKYDKSTYNRLYAGELENWEQNLELFKGDLYKEDSTRLEEIGERV